jgi:hypothetical protein
MYRHQQWIMLFFTIDVPAAPRTRNFHFPQSQSEKRSSKYDCKNDLRGLGYKQAICVENESSSQEQYRK